MNNIYVLNKNYKKIGTLSNQGVNPHAPYYNDLYIQDLETGADTYQFSTVSTQFTQDCIEVGNHIMFSYKNRNELFTITSLEYSHNEGYKTVGVYAESVGFELLDVYMERPKKTESDDDEGGTDNDNDGDDNYDDEYADVDDIYIDENGNIIYDKDGSGLGDVTIDGDGNIIYKPKNNKKYKDRPSDFLEFKNISYPTFIKTILKNTGWSYVCQPGLESNKQDVRVSYDTNIFAILQDSMQDYKGVELEFVYEYNNGKVQKTVKAYKDGGRGSFVGKRFEYGTNVKGITKTQKVANNEDDTVLFIDNIGIEVYYDVDFALKSAEIPEIEIGDTHYVIDREFHPPLEIKARIGKIEISFTDSTKNKIYLANNKKIRGSALENEYEDYTDDDSVPDHVHHELVSTIGAGANTVGYYGGVFGPGSGPGDAICSLGSPTRPWNLFYVNTIQCLSTVHVATGIRTASLDVDDILVRGTIKLANGSTINGGSSSGGNTSGYKPSNPDPGSSSSDGSNGDLTDIDILDAKTIKANAANFGDLYTDSIIFADGTIITTANGSGGAGDNIFQKVSDRFYYTDNDIQIERDLYVNGTLHVNSGDGMGMGIVDCDILKVVEIQFANGTTLPVNNIATVSELSEYATVEALQEEIRAKDEQIASLEARLAKIEALLDINND